MKRENFIRSIFAPRLNAIKKAWAKGHGGDPIAYYDHWHCKTCDAELDRWCDVCKRWYNQDLSYEGLMADMACVEHELFLRCRKGCKQ